MTIGVLVGVCFIIAVCGYLVREKKPAVPQGETPSPVVASEASSETPSKTPDRPISREATLLVIAKEMLSMDLIADPAEITPIPVAIETAAALNDPEGDGKTDVEMVQALFTIYQKANDGNPYGGFNAEIMAGLLGHNPNKLAVINPDHPAIDDQGQLLDRWGTPYNFHPVSGEKMVVKSAGPDREFYTDDDIER